MPAVVAPFLISQCYNKTRCHGVQGGVVAPFLISQCYNFSNVFAPVSVVVAPFLISQCYNRRRAWSRIRHVVAPFLISQCYNVDKVLKCVVLVVAPFLISQCYNMCHAPICNPIPLKRQVRAAAPIQTANQNLTQIPIPIQTTSPMKSPKKASFVAFFRIFSPAKKWANQMNLYLMT